MPEAAPGPGAELKNQRVNEIKKRRNNWKNPKPIPKKGVLAKYAKTVQSASEGAVTD